VELRCRSCGAVYGLQEYSANLDDLLEEFLAHVPCDRV
jgi:hypothetical protein